MNKRTSNYLLILAIFATSVIRSNAQEFFFSTESPSSCGATDGIATIVPMRGVPPFSYLWSNGATELSIKNVPKGVYMATLTDASGATVIHTCYLNSRDLELERVSGLPSGGCNPNSGAIAVAPIAGLPPYTYIWSNGMTGTDIQGLATGEYTVTVQDANGCEAVNAFVVEPLWSPYTLYASINTDVQPDCGNPNIGNINGFLTYGYYQPLDYQWSTGAVSQTLSNLSDGTYSVTITDALGCTANATINLYNKLSTTGSVLCTGNGTGTLDAALINGVAPVNYIWSHGLTGTHLDNQNDGAYSVTATDALGCTSVASETVQAPNLGVSYGAPYCYTGNEGFAQAWVYGDVAVSYLWDNGEATYFATQLSPGLHSVTVTTAMGCVLNGIADIPGPSAPGISVTATATPADCGNNIGGALNISVQGGTPPFNYSIYGSNGFYTTDISNLTNLLAGDYYIYVYSLNSSCGGNATVNIPDNGGFEPTINVGKLDCSTGYGSAEILGVSTPGVQYSWSNGANSSAIFSLTEGCYSVTVSAGASCNKFYEFCMFAEDSVFTQNNCTALAEGKLINDLGVPGCNGSIGIPFQMIRTLPSGALNFTDADGNYNVSLADGPFELEAANYNPLDIACPVGAKHSIIAAIGTTTSGLDFHYLNNNAIDHRVKQRALRTAQPGYPYSIRVEVCNDGASSNPGTLDLLYGNFLGPVTGHNFAQHPGAFSLNNETSGIPNNGATFSFPAIASGNCELLQLDLETNPGTALNTAFVTEASVSPISGDPTPDNNKSVQYSTVMGAFDPNCVLAFPARNGNPRDGGEILRYEDNTIVYQIFFQNTGNAPANLVIVQDSLDASLDISSIRNITASHDMKVSMGYNNDVVVFKFNNINLPDSTSDYANSIGSIQYEIDLKPGLALGTEIKKRAGIFFDFNMPISTNQNVLEIVNSVKTQVPNTGNALVLFPNPSDTHFGFHCDTPSKISVYNALGVLVLERTFESGLQQINATDLQSGVYMVQLEANGKIKNGKVVVSH